MQSAPFRRTLELVALGVDDDRLDAEQRTGGGAGLELRAARERGDHHAAGLGLPPGVDDGAARIADHVVVPLPGLRVDGLAHGAEDAHARAAGALDEVVALAHQGPDRGRRGVEDVHPELVADLPEAAEVRVVRDPLEHHGGGAVRERRVHHVRVPRDPADIRGAPEGVAFVVVEDVLERERGVEQVSPLVVLHALRRAGRSRGVEDEQRVLGVEFLRGAVRRGVRHHLVVPDVAAVSPRHIVAGAAHHDAGVGVRAPLQGRVGVLLQRHVAPAARALVRGDHHPAVGVEDAVAQRVRARTRRTPRSAPRRSARRRASPPPPRAPSACRRRPGRPSRRLWT